MVGAPADRRMPDAASERNVKSVLALITAMLCAVVVSAVREQNRDSLILLQPAYIQAIHAINGQFWQLILILNFAKNH